ncbi:hypothetical protein LPJ61_001925 [Coemansia biformis]|uniref:Glycosyltransferase family 15 protein n=1 Tax=Coemansia biformis TaxID=1286918 RepID=A0A9W8CZM5_9FUNG|nr:hypothetical protein LPJ61_001925 [Coemansia biformis]
MLGSRRAVAVAKFVGVLAVLGLLLHLGTTLFSTRYNTTGQGFFDMWGNSLATNAEYGGSQSGAQGDYRPGTPKPVKGALVALVRNEDLYGMRKSIRELEDRWNHKYNYPYIFLNDKPFTDKFKKGVQDLTKATVQFGTLEPESWGYPSWIDQEKARTERETAKYIKGHSESYRFMCRFQSGFVYKHPMLVDLDYYWRIEPDVHYYCDIDYDPFLYMKTNGLKYGWNIAPTEYEPTVRTLWNVTQEFMIRNPDMLPKESMIDWVRDSNGAYTRCHFWSNFEIVDLSFYRSPQYEAYFNFLDRAGGFFYERWGDAPIHSLAVAMFLKKSDVHYFDDIGYYHPAMSHCPDGSKERGKCVCDPKEGWANGFGCAKLWRQIS